MFKVNNKDTRATPLTFMFPLNRQKTVKICDNVRENRS